MKPLYFSVESRKGGVGKTTAALNLCKCLINNHYEVLLLDCDITGTTISDICCDSDFWQNQVNVIGEEKNGKQVPLNLLSRFCDDGLTIDLKKYVTGKINIIGSDLYENNELIIDPRYLMDELHSYWLISQLKEISEGFYNNYKETKSVVVIDNSPGYIGLSRTIHEWLTDLDPTYCRFLLVSSIDPQDIVSSLAAASEIRRMMDGKIRTAHYFESLKRGNSLNKTEEEFLNRNNQFNRFFYKCAEGHEFNGDVGSSLSDYATILFNRVPVEILEPDTDYDFEEVLKDKESLKILKELIGSDYSARMLAYDPFVNTQFFGKYLKYKRADNEIYWSRRFSRLALDTDPLRGEYDVVAVAYKLDGYVKRLLDSMRRRGSIHLANSIHDAWMPAYCFLGLNAVIDRIPYYIRPEATTQLREEMRQEIYNIAMERVVDFINLKSNLLSKYEPVIRSLFQYILKRAGAEKEKRNIGLMAAISLFINVMIRVLRVRYKGEDFHNFIQQEMNNPKRGDLSIIEDRIIQISQSIKIDLNAETMYTDLLRNNFSKFYTSACYAMLRLIDLFEDFDFLVEVLKRLTGYSRKRLFPKEVKEALDITIARKTERLDIHTIDMYLSDACYMKDFEDAINEILKQWKI